MPPKPQHRPRPSAPRAPAPAKISAPRPGAAVPRPRLFRLVDQAARRPVIWIEGPAGSGKTTLATGWLARHRLRTLWFQVDGRDRDPASFFYYLREAAARLAPRRRDPLPLLAPEYVPDLRTYARNFFEGLFDRLGAPAALVLDDFQELPEDAPLLRVLPDVLSAVPAGIHVLVLSRTAPPPELSRLRANSLVATIGWEALRFTPREAAGLVAAHGLPRAGAGALARLYDDAGGWAAGLVLIGEAWRRCASRATHDEGRRPAELFEYFANVLFDDAAPELQRVLLATGVLPEVTPVVAERLAGAGAATHLERLARHNVFTTRTAGSAPVYRFHPLFRAFLRARAETDLSPAQRSELRRRAAAQLDEAGRTEDAIALLLEAGDAAGARALVLRIAPALEAQGRLETLEGWVRALPADEREADPWVLHWLGACRVTKSPRESLSLHHRAFAEFLARGDDRGAVASATRAVDAILFAFEDLAQLDPWLRWLEERVRSGPLPTPSLDAHATASLAVGLLWRTPSHPDLDAWYARLAAMVHAAPPTERVRGLALVLWYRTWTGDHAGTAACAAELELAARAPGVAPAHRILALDVLAAAANHTAADPRRALALAAEGLRIGEAEGIHGIDHFLHARAACAHLTLDAPATAEPHLAAMRALSTAALFGGGAVHLLLEAWRAHLLGDQDGALALAERALGTTRASGAAMTEPHVHFVVAQLQRARGDRGAALPHLAIAEARAAAERCVPAAWLCKLMRAQLALDAGDREGCRALLATALAEGRARGFESAPWWSTRTVLAGLCEEALDAGIEPEYVRRLVRLHALAPDPARPGAERWPFPVRIRALGPFVLDRAGAAAPAKGRSKPLDLLKALVALGGRDVPEERLVELLWPDAEGDLGRQRLKFTLHALRKLLGTDDVVVLEKGLLSLDPRRVWVDAWALERRLDRLGALLASRRAEELAGALDDVLAMARGPLLDGEPAPWALEARERLRARVVRLVAQAGEALAPRDPGAAAARLERALEPFPREERLLRALAGARAHAG